MGNNIFKDKLFISYWQEVNHLDDTETKKVVLGKKETILAWIIAIGLSILTIYNAVLELSVKIK